jgi:hypothetical protein
LTSKFFVVCFFWFLLFRSLSTGYTQARAQLCDDGGGGDFLTLTRDQQTEQKKKGKKGIKIKTVQSMVELIVSSSRGSSFFFLQLFFVFCYFPRKWENRKRDS